MVFRILAVEEYAVLRRLLSPLHLHDRVKIWYFQFHHQVPLSPCQRKINLQVGKPDNR